MEKLAIVALKYLEPDYRQTEDCITATQLPVHQAHRDGVGNMSRAFNEAFLKHIKGNYEYVWFVTNVRFAPDVPGKLLQVLESGYSAVHPNFLSDHIHIRNNGTQDPVEVPFIEFTAPMFRVADFERFMLCEETWYYYMDLIISQQMRAAGLKMAVHNGCQVEHTYLRNVGAPHAISRLRAEMRRLITPSNKLYMEQVYGANWQFDLWKQFI